MKFLIFWKKHIVTSFASSKTSPELLASGVGLPIIRMCQHWSNHLYYKHNIIIKRESKSCCLAHSIARSYFELFRRISVQHNVTPIGRHVSFWWIWMVDCLRRHWPTRLAWLFTSAKVGEISLSDFDRVKSNVSPRLSTSTYPREFLDRTSSLGVL